MINRTARLIISLVSLMAFTLLMCLAWNKYIPTYYLIAAVPGIFWSSAALAVSFFTRKA